MDDYEEPTTYIENEKIPYRRKKVSLVCGNNSSNAELLCKALETKYDICRIFGNVCKDCAETAIDISEDCISGYYNRLQRERALRKFVE